MRFWRTFAGLCHAGHRPRQATAIAPLHGKRSYEARAPHLSRTSSMCMCFCKRPFSSLLVRCLETLASLGDVRLAARRSRVEDWRLAPAHRLWSCVPEHRFSSGATRWRAKIGLRYCATRVGHMSDPACPFFGYATLLVKARLAATGVLTRLGGRRGRSDSMRCIHLCFACMAQAETCRWEGCLRKTLYIPQAALQGQSEGGGNSCIRYSLVAFAPDACQTESELVVCMHACMIGDASDVAVTSFTVIVC